MASNISSYSPSLILKVAKTLREKGYNFKPWYDSEWEENDSIIKDVSEMYGFEIPIDFFIGLHEKNLDKDIFAPDFNPKNLRYPELENFTVTVFAVVLETKNEEWEHKIDSYSQLPIRVEKLFNHLLREGEVYWNDGELTGEDVRDVETHDVAAGRVVLSRQLNESVQKRKTKLESLDRNQLLRLRKLIDEQLNR